MRKFPSAVYVKKKKKKKKKELKCWHISSYGQTRNIFSSTLHTKITTKCNFIVLSQSQMNEILSTTDKFHKRSILSLTVKNFINSK